jgi:hypothetical protein
VGPQSPDWVSNSSRSNASIIAHDLRSQHLGFDLPVQTTSGPHQSRMESDSAADRRPASRELKRGNATLAEPYGADAVRVDTAQVGQEFKRGVRTFEQQTWCRHQFRVPRRRTRGVQRSIVRLRNEDKLLLD